MTDGIWGKPYHKINSAFKRDMSVKGNPVIPGEWAQPEFEYLQGSLWSWTEKIDGTNTRLHWNGDTVTLGGRTDNAQIPVHLTEAIRSMGLLDPEKWEEKWPVENDIEPSVTIYGEGYGPKIQKGGGLYRDDVSFIVFDVRVGNWWLKREGVEEIAEYFGLETVPLWGTASPRDMWDIVCSGELYSSRFPKAPIEGVVGTPQVPLFSRAGERVIMKMKVRDWEQLERTRQ